MIILILIAALFTIHTPYTLTENLRICAEERNDVTNDLSTVAVMIEVWSQPFIARAPSPIDVKLQFRDPGDTAGKARGEQVEIVR